MGTPSFSWQNNNSTNISTLSNYYFNYSANGWNTEITDIGTFNLKIQGELSSTGTLRDGRYANKGIGDPCTYYLGSPWRLPTKDEFKALFDSYNGGISWPIASFNWQNNPRGIIRTNTSPSSLFLSCGTGIRQYSDGSFTKSDYEGIYLTSSMKFDQTSPSLTQGIDALIGSGWIYANDASFPRSTGEVVRCVSSVNP